MVSFTLFGEDRQLLVLVHNEGFKAGHLLCFSTPYTTKPPTFLAKDVELGINKASRRVNGVMVMKLCVLRLVIQAEERVVQ